MDEEKKTGLADAVETGASAAHTIKGAIKAGKAISGAAKGAAAGGPYGAVAGAVWAGRKHIGKIIAVIIILLLLPVLFILMLPGLIFGGLVNAFSPADSEAPVLNSETAIVENANDITFTINSILGEALDDVMARIEEDFASSGADHMEIKNSYSSGPVFNANLIISQYCAARDEDFESISLDDLAAVLRDNKEHLYSYTSVQESREVTTEDPETGEETTTTETWIIYTIRYGEAGFHITTPKTASGTRTIPILYPQVAEQLRALIEVMDALYPEDLVMNGYHGFLFRNRSGYFLSAHNINRAIERISIAYNAEEMDQAELEDREPNLLPHFSVHNLRHTFCTRLCEKTNDIKFIQQVMGHADFSTTMDIYTHITQESMKEKAEVIKDDLVLM